MKRIRQTQDVPLPGDTPQRVRGDYVFPKKMTMTGCPQMVDGKRCTGMLWQFVGMKVYTCERCGENAWQV